MVEATVGMIGAAKVISEVSKNEAVRQSVGSWFNKLAAQIKVSTFDVAALSNLFSNYMSSSYERCGYVKTFASEDAPVPISQIYVSPNFSYTHRKIDDYTAMQIILDKKRTIIEATGGMGKTIFMKHFWTKVFHEHNYLIPIFFELKKFTDKETTDFVSFVRIHISGSHMNKEMFAELCEAGALIFFFDGLDEVHSEARQVVEKGIKDIAGRYPKIRIVVTTRPDPQVRGWDTFHVLRPTALTLDQAVSVVDKISFDPEIKKSFISNVKATLYKKHEDFLSNPLLINIMLITFKEFAEIPDKVTVFYEYAFDVLYQRHDAKKDGYLREKKSGLAPDEFKDFFSYFCFSSYASGLTEFRPEEFKTHSAVASKLSGFKVQGDHFRADLIDAVCMLRDEGVSYAFSHRSFQEFFAARAIARLDEERMYKSCIKFISQRASNVVKMFANYDLRRFEFGFAERYLTEKLPEQSLREIDTLSAADAFFDTLDVAVFVRVRDLSSKEMGPKIILATQIDGFLYYSNFEFLFEDVKNLIKRQATSKSIQTATKILIAKRTNDFLVLTEERKVSEKWKYVRGAPVRSIKDATPFSTHYISMAESLRAVLHAKLNDIRKRKKVMGKSADDIINQLFAP